MPARFHIPDLRAAGLVVSLPAGESHHAAAVLRLAEKEQVIFFDGAGTWARARLERVGKSGVTARLEGELHLDPPAPLQLTLATAAPKGERAEWLIEQASQLNAAAVQWMDCDRSVVKPREGGGKMDKWRRLAVESAKQCGRTHVLQVLEPEPLSEVLGGAGEARILWLDPGAGGKKVTAALAGMAAGRVLALIGPEGGWSDGERTALEAAVKEGKLQRVRLTETVLRIETACAALAAVVMG